MEYIEKLHLEILDIMDVIHSICQKNRKKYYMTGGTLLGAVRHKGFIPWDDDLDIAMPREDFDWFVTEGYQQLPEGYALAWFTTEPDYEHLFAKVYKQNTLFLEEVIDGGMISRGIFVDIFPLDSTNGVNWMTLLQKKLIGKLKGFLCVKKSPKKLKQGKYLWLKLVPTKLLSSIAIGCAQIQKKDYSNFYSNFGSQYQIKKQTFEKSVWGEGVLLTFAGRKYMAPDRYALVLSQIFGEKYMELPPVDKRRTHYPLKVVFSDGEGIEFTPVTDRVKVDV